METKNDYFNDVLGISLKGPGMALETSVETVDRKSFLFYADIEDFEENKDFVSKILNAVKQNDGIVIMNIADLKKINPLEVFSFGEAIELMGVKVHSFPTLSEIANDQGLKVKLWGELKKRTDPESFV